MIRAEEGRRRRARLARLRYLDDLLKDPNVAVERKSFYHDLASFYRRKWNVRLEIPAVNGVNVDLFDLYSRVSKLGGWLKVSSAGRWWDVAESLGIKDDLCGADHALKLVYMRYLNRYEKVRLFGDLGEEEHDESGRSGRSRGALLTTLATADCPYIRPRGDFSEAVRRSLSLPVPGPNLHAQLIRSLESGLPNELDFAINILTLLSHPGPKLLRLADAPRVLTLLLAHIGIFENGPESLRDLYFDGWRVESRLPFLEFWEAGALEPETWALVASGRPKPLPMDDDLFVGISPSFDPSKPLTHRVLQIASILRNLSFEAPNRAPMATSAPLMKLIAICINSKYTQLQSIAWDILSNVACEMVIGGPEETERCELVLRCLARGLASDDKMPVIRALETLSGLCGREDNEEILSQFLTSPILRKIISFVVVRDIMLAVYVLEALYQITELGPETSERIANEEHAINVLVDMATVEAVSFGPSGLAGMKVVEYGVPQGSSQLPGLPVQQPTRIQRLVATSMPPPPVPTTPMRVSSPMVVSGVAGAPVRASTMVVRAPAPLPPPPPAPPAPVPRPIVTPAGVPSLLAAFHPGSTGKPVDPEQQDQQAEDLVVTWLQTNLQSDPTGSVSRGELYAAYVGEMHKVYMSLAVSASTFGSLIKKNFPHVTIRRVEGGSRPNMMQLDGVRYVPKQIPFSPPPASLSKALPSMAQSHPLVNSILSSSPSPATPKRQLTTVSGKTGPVRILVVRKNNDSAEPEANNPSLNGQGTAKLEKLPANCHLEVCEQAQEAKNILDNGPPAPLSNGAKDPEPTNNNAATPKTPNGPLTNGMNGVKPHLSEMPDSKNNASARTPSPDSMNRNLINCQANIAELLKTEEKTNGANGMATPSPRGRGRGRGRGTLSQDTSSPGASRDSFASPSTEDSQDSADNRPSTSTPVPNLCSTPNPADAPKPKKSHKKKKPHELIRNQKAAAALLAAQQKATMEAELAAKRAAEAALEPPPEPKRPRIQQPPAQSQASHPSTPAQPSQTPAFRTLTIPAPANIKFMCEWNGCTEVYEKAHEVYLHAARDHVTTESRACLWPHCDPNVPRHHWSLTTHLQDIHCSEAALRTAALRRYEMSVSSTGESSIPAPRTPPPHPGYSRTAAFDAVRRHALNFLPKEITEENEGPVTKSIRLTSCLILRNLARYSPEGRRKIRKYEGSLAILALSRLESSTTLSQLLHELSQPLTIQPPQATQ